MLRWPCLIRRPNPVKHRLPRGGNACDFCGVQSVAQLHPCTVFVWEGIPIFRSPSGHWASCSDCGELIARKRWKALTARVMAEVAHRAGLTHTELLRLGKELTEMHRLFALHRRRGMVLNVLERAAGAVNAVLI